MATLDDEARFVGCLLGGGAGDALGAAVEFFGLEKIREQFGKDGLTDYAPAYGRKGAITDDTQMTMFTAEGLLRADARRRSGDEADTVAVVHRAYLRWLHTQGRRSRHPEYDDALDGWLIRIPSLHDSRAPGNTCLSALMAERMGDRSQPLNGSKGCGGVMRIAPVGLWPCDHFTVGCDIAAITHGHPSGYLAAGLLATIIGTIVDGVPLDLAIRRTFEAVSAKLNDEVRDAVVGALKAADANEATPEAVARLGEGWVAEEALAIGLFCALVAKDFRHGVLLAVNHAGDSDSTGAITGNLLGAARGRSAIPSEWIEPLELREEIEQLARDLATVSRGESPDPSLYAPR